VPGWLTDPGSRSRSYERRPGTESGTWGTSRDHPAYDPGLGVTLQSIEALLFDVGGVLTLPRHDPILEACRGLGAEVDAALIDQAHYLGVHGIDDAPEMDELTPAGSFARADEQVYLAAYARALGLPAERGPAILQSVFRTTPRLWWRRIEESVLAFRELASLGLPIAIVSNSDGTVEESLRGLEICQVGAGSGVEVRAIVDSRTVGAHKPDPAIFRFALDAVGVEPSRCVYVGDTIRFDVRGALAAGIHPVLFEPFPRRSSTVSAPRIRRLGELLDLIRDW
jgi:FMN phosphatase YigB (HAD superfamily)